jgi:hypothetical protein
MLSHARRDREINAMHNPPLGANDTNRATLLPRLTVCSRCQVLSFGFLQDDFDVNEWIDRGPLEGVFKAATE